MMKFHDGQSDRRTHRKVSKFHVNVRTISWRALSPQFVPGPPEVVVFGHGKRSGTPSVVVDVALTPGVRMAADPRVVTSGVPAQQPQTSLGTLWRPSARTRPHISGRV